MAPYVICGEITFEVTAKCLEWLAKNRASPVELWLCSEGGDAAAGMALYSAFKSHGESVTIVIHGCCESIASVILQAADCRKIAPDAYIQLHRGTVSLEDIVPEEQAVTAAFLNYYYDRLDNIVYLRMKASGSKLSRRRYREEVRRAVFFTATEALRNGLVDEIMEG